MMPRTVNISGRAIPEWAAGELPSTWKTAGRGWGHPLHKLAPYVGSFPAQLARFFILNLSDPGATVLDPWAGGGTTPLEAALCERKPIASDVFEYAHVLTHAKSNPLDEDTFACYLSEKLAHAEKVSNRNWQLLDNPDLHVFFSDHTLDQLLRLRTVLQADQTSEALFLKAVVAGVLHGPSKMFLSAPQKDQTSSTVGYVKRYLERHQIERPLRDIYEAAMTKARRSLLSQLPRTKADVLRSDSRHLAIPDACVDLVVTSPPYMAVLDYSWNNWLRLWWLGKDRLSERAGMTLTRQEERYRTFMRASVGELYRVMRPNSAAVIVVGDVRQGTNERASILNSALLIAAEALPIGFDVECVIDDVYQLKARSMLVLNRIKWGYEEAAHADRSSVLIDRCLVLKKGRVEWRWPTISWARMRSLQAYRAGQVEADPEFDFSDRSAERVV